MTVFEMLPFLARLGLTCTLLLLLTYVQGFQSPSYIGNAPGRSKVAFPDSVSRTHFLSTTRVVRLSLSTSDEDSNDASTDSLSPTIFEQLAQSFVSQDFAKRPDELKRYVQLITLFRVGLPSVAIASAACLSYPYLSMYIAGIINDSGAFEVIAQDYSQYIQNILTTSGLMFSILVGYTYYFLYQQQENVYLALFEEVTVAKMLLEQVSLVCEGRKSMYQTVLERINRYVRDDLTQFSVEPAVLLSSRPIDDPLEDIMYLTSVGEPSVVYQTVRSLRQARAHRLGALQRKLPQIHIVLLLSLAGVVLFTFPVLGAGVQTIGGPGILSIQSWYLSFIVFGISMNIGVISELNQPAGNGAYNVVTVMSTMVEGLEEELEGRMADKYMPSAFSPTNDVVKPSMEPPTMDHDIYMANTYSPTNDVLKPQESVLVDRYMMGGPSTESAVDNHLKQSTKESSSSHENDDSSWFGKRLVNRIRNRINR